MQTYILLISDSWKASVFLVMFVIDFSHCFPPFFCLFFLSGWFQGFVTLTPTFANSNRAESAWAVQIRLGSRSTCPKVHQAHNAALGGTQQRTNWEFMKRVWSEPCEVGTALWEPIMLPTPLSLW